MKNKIERITVFGGTNSSSYSQEMIDKCSRLGKFIAENKLDILTGACKGMPYYTAKAAIAAGGKVIGYSPARNEKDHIEKYGFPLDGTTEIIYEEHLESPFLKRSQDMMPYSDVVIALGGSWGTFVELVFSLFYNKTIILVEEFDGAVKQFIDSYNYFGSRDVNPTVHNGCTIYKVKTTDDAITKLKELI